MKKENGKLYIVATPIGNLEDITLRAIKILKEVDIIAAEDTRHTLKLLNHLDISKPLISYHRHNEEEKTESLIGKLLEGCNIALVSDAGTPGVSDPGEVIIKKCIEKNIPIVPIPGACALVNALICSGIETSEFVFFGFLPLNKKLRKNKLEEIKISNKTIILYEAPHKLMNTLKDLKEILGDRNITLAKEMTKIHEEFIRGDIDSIIEKSENIKGEIVLIIEGNKCKEKKYNFEDMDLVEHYKMYENQGFEKKDIIKKIAKDRGLNKNEIYKKFIKNT